MTDTLQTVREAVAHVLATPLGAVSGVADVQPDSNLLALGADDLDLIGIALEMEERFGREFPEEDLRECSTVSDLVALVENGQ